MDPQKLSQLDPKLREAYQRVMGTSIPQPQVAPASPTLPLRRVEDEASQRGEPVQTQTPTPPPVPTPLPAEAPAKEEDPIPTPTPVPEPEPTPVPTPTIEEPTGAPVEPPVQPPTPPVSKPQSIPTSQSSIPEPQPAIPTESPAIPPTQEPAIPQQPPAQATNFDQMNSEVPVPSQNFTAPAPMAQTVVIKKKNHMIPILIGATGLIFVAVYTLFWTKIFNFQLPFLP